MMKENKNRMLYASSKENYFEYVKKRERTVIFEIISPN